MLEETLRWVAAGATIIAACLVSFAGSNKLTALGFAIFCVASSAWIVASLMVDGMALLAQNTVLLAINVFGVWRWSKRA